MTTPEFDDLEKQLAGLTQWHGREPQIWRKALRAADKTGRVRRLLSFVRNRPIVTAAAACLVLAAVGTSLLQLQTPTYLGNPRGYFRYSVVEQRPRNFICASSEQPSSPADNPQQYWDSAGVSQTKYGFQIMEGENLTAASGRGQGQSTTILQATQSDRKVVRKVTLQLSTPDVRATYLRAAHLVSEARGEFVQDSAVTGSGNQTQANLTLRVAADRLPEVLNQLRELGKVESEQANGEDVTEQAVDLEARLDNERRVETELQKLLETRQSSPLEDVLKLRDKLSEVRGSIERLTAQRDKLNRLVSLATVLVIIRPADAPVPAAPTIKDYFANAISLAWSRSLRFLADTVAAFLAVLIGGIIWWVLLVVLIIVAMRYRRRKPERDERRD